MSFVDDAELRGALRKPFDPKQIGKLPRKYKKQDGSYGEFKLDYVGHASVTDRLNQVDPGWTYEILERIEYIGSDQHKHLEAIIGAITIGGKTMVEAGDVDRPGRYGEELKLAIGDFIRRGAMRFGVALDLWSREDLQSADVPAVSGSAAVASPQVANAEAGSTHEVSPASAEQPSNPDWDDLSKRPLMIQLRRDIRYLDSNITRDDLTPLTYQELVDKHAEMSKQAARAGTASA